MNRPLVPDAVPWALAGLLAAALPAGPIGCNRGGKPSPAPPRANATQTPTTTGEVSATGMPPAGEAPTLTPAEAEALRRDFLRRYDLTGRVTLIQFGLVGCKLSEEGLEEMAFLHGSEEIPQLAYVRVEGSTDDAAVKEYYQAKAVKFPVCRDAAAKLAAAFGATTWPSYVLIGKFGRIRYRGAWPGRPLDDWVAALAAETADPGPDVALLGTVTFDLPRLLAETRLPVVGEREPVALADLAGDGGLLLLFVDTSCPYSAQAMGELPVVARALGPLGIATAAVCIDGTREDVEGRFGPGASAVPLLYDTTRATRKAWHVQSVPTAAFVSPDNRLAYYGRAVWTDLARAIEADRGLRPGSVRFTAHGTGYG